MKQQEYMDFIDRFEGSSLTVLTIETESWKMHMEKGAAPVAAAGAQPAVKAEPIAAPQPKEAETGDFVKVKAPLVGTFYRAPSPEDAPYAAEGDRVQKGQVLCLIEAMKMMNELKAPANGILRAVCAEDGQMVEYGQILFEVAPC